MLRRRPRPDRAPSTASAVQVFLARLQTGESLELVVNPASSPPLDVRRTVLLRAALRCGRGRPRDQTASQHCGS
jgi:hypothetical protein